MNFIKTHKYPLSITLSLIAFFFIFQNGTCQNATVSGTNSQQTSNPTSLSVYPSVTTVALGSQVQFSVSGGTAPYQYLLVSGTGSVSSSGVYAAPSSATTALIQIYDAVSNVVQATVNVSASASPTPSPFGNPIRVVGNVNNIWNFPGSVNYSSTLSGGGSLLVYFNQHIGDISTNYPYTVTYTPTTGGFTTTGYANSAGIVVTNTYSNALILQNNQILIFGACFQITPASGAIAKCSGGGTVGYVHKYGANSIPTHTTAQIISHLKAGGFAMAYFNQTFNNHKAHRPYQITYNPQNGGFTTEGYKSSSFPPFGHNASYTFQNALIIDSGHILVWGGACLKMNPNGDLIPCAGGAVLGFIHI